VPKSEQIHIQKHVSLEELNKNIRSERDGRILKRLYFVKYRYEGESVAASSQRVGITRSVGYLWQEKWNTNGYDGLIPRYWGGWGHAKILYVLYPPASRTPYTTHFINYVYPKIPQKCSKFIFSSKTFEGKKTNTHPYKNTNNRENHV